MHPYIPILDAMREPFYRGSVPRFLDGGRGSFRRCKTIKNIRRYTSVKGIVVRQVGAYAETAANIVSNTPLHARAIRCA